MKNKDTLIILLITLVLALSCLPLFKNIHHINVNWDWLQHLAFARVSRQAVLEHGQFPLRTPYFNGGYPLIGHPLENTLNPFFLPILIFGENLGLKINIFLFHLLGGWGMYYLTRHVLKFTSLGALFSVFTFCLGGNLHRLLMVGMAYYPQVTYFFIPLLLALLIKSKEEKKYFIYFVVLSAVLRFSISIFLFLFLFSLLEIIKFKERRIRFDFSLIRNLSLALLLAFLLGAAKNFPVIELLRQNPRPSESYLPFWGPLALQASLSVNLFHAFLVHKWNFPYLGQHWNYLYLGYLPMLFALLSFLMYWRKMSRFFILFVLFALLGFGAHTRLDLFRLFWHLPVFRSIEAPTRHFIPFVIFLVALAAGQFFSIAEKTRIKPVKSLLFLVLCLVTIDLFWINRAGGDSFPSALPSYVRSPAFFQVKNSEAGRAVSPFVPQNVFLIRSWEWTRPTPYESMLQNIGKINAYTIIRLGEYATPKYYIDWNGEDSLDPKNYNGRLNPDYKGEVYFLNHPDNKAEFKYFSPNKITARVSLVAPDTLIINQNYDKYWKGSLSKPMNHQGLLAMNLEKKGDYLVTFTYVPLSFYFGLGTSLVTLIFIIYLWRKK